MDDGAPVPVTDNDSEGVTGVSDRLALTCDIIAAVLLV